MNKVTLKAYKRDEMGSSRTPFICFSLLLLMLQSEALTSSIQGSIPSPKESSNSGLTSEQKDGGDVDVFADYKRKVNSGSNPLHNR
ncbi:hypothetical protein HanIR_Chr15g0735741 [Helianthus annuus]|nr:hypothetical protein HanIR_Chr15g0735741 [Helianthus annuus]